MIRDDSDATWERFGKENPYYGVLGHEKYRLGNLSEEGKAEFFASGEAHVQRLLSAAVRHFGMTGRQSALDFGCGVGRLVIPLAKEFEHVTGVDVSPSMLAEAEQNCRDRDISNAIFVHSDDELTQVTGSYDFIHSYIVLQHIPVGRGERLMERLIKYLKPGGVIALHVPFVRRASTLRRTVNWARRHFTPLSILVNVIQGQRWNEPFMQMNSYDTNRILQMFLAHGMRDVWVELIDTGEYIQAFFVVSSPGAEAPDRG